MQAIRLNSKDVGRELAIAYLPVVRGFLLAAGVYYVLIAASHPLYETGLDLLVLEGLAMLSAAAAFLCWRDLRQPTGLHRLETVALGFDALMMANVVAYMLLHFEPLKLVYFVLMALVFGTAAPSLRVAVLGVVAAWAALIYFAFDAPGDLISQYAFVGLAGAFAAIGMTTLMRGVIVREVRARLTGDMLNERLGAELERNQRLAEAAESLAIEAQSASRAKSAFLATMSHEIRTPLNGVLGVAQVMQRGGLAKTQRQRLGLIQASAQTLLDIVNDVLDISKIEAGRMDMHAEPFDLDGFMQGFETLYAGLAREKGLRLTCRLGPGAGGWRLGDAIRLRQVLSNLTSNALKFTDSGAIAIAVETGPGGRLRFSVTDSGAGIPASQQGRIFETFFQADGSATRRQGGTGLGLAICRQLVSLMGGEMGFDSTEGAGSCFWFSLPLEPAEGPPLAAPDTDAPDTDAPGKAASASPAGAGLRVLVVDDNPTNRLILAELLANVGIDSGVATDGLQAVEAWKHGGWDAILMDVHMPHMDGLEATRAIRAAEAASRRPRTPIVAVTASVLSHETNRYSQAGMDGLIAKPIKAEQLLSVLDRCLAEAAPNSNAA